MGRPRSTAKPGIAARTVRSRRRKSALSKPSDPLLSQGEARGRFNYSPETGIFTCRATGKPAGIPNADGYLIVRIGGKNVGLHRLAFMWMLGHWPVELVDHVNGDRADNRWSNIRPATARQNSQNRRPTDANFGYKGVKRNRHGRWIATIQVNGVIRRIPGTFESAYAAHQAYKAAALEAFGQFARYDHPKTPELPKDVGAELAALKKRRDDVARQLNDIDAAIKALEPIHAAAVERNEKIRAARKREAARVAELKSQGYKPPLNPIVPPYHPERR